MNSRVVARWKIDWPMTKGELLDNIALFVIFYFYSNDDRLQLV